MKSQIIVPADTNIKECLHCSKPFIAQRRSAKYCTAKCKQMAYLKRKGFTVNSLSPIVKQTNKVKRKDGLFKRFLKFLW
jgi:hypothetical protein